MRNPYGNPLRRVVHGNAHALRGTTTEQGYGQPHRIERERWRPKVEAGVTWCAHCGLPIAADAPWDLAHDHESGRGGYMGPAHAGCNRRDANVRRAKRRTSRVW